MARSRRSIAFLIAVATIGLVAGATETPSIEFMAWRYGVIAWIGQKPAGWDAISSTATEAVEDVFTLWELPVPEPTGNWENPSLNPRHFGSSKVSQVLKRNPATGEMWRLNPLRWGDEETHPLLLILFPDAETMAEATRKTTLGGFLYESGLGSKVWFQGLTDVPRSIFCLAGDVRVLRHELAHWMTSVSLGWPGYLAACIPDYVMEGIADHTAEILGGTAYSQQSRGLQPLVGDWTSEHSLTDEGVEYNPYWIGTSLVSYLFLKMGPSELLASLPRWCSTRTTMLLEHQPGWHAYLKLVLPILEAPPAQAL